MKRISEHFLALDEWREIDARADVLAHRFRICRTMALASLLVHSTLPFPLLAAVFPHDLTARWVHLPSRAWWWVDRLCRRRRRRLGPLHQGSHLFGRPIRGRGVFPMRPAIFERELRVISAATGCGPLSLRALQHVAGARSLPPEPCPYRLA